MDKELKELLESKKSDGKTKKGCTSCKKKKHEVILEPVVNEEIYVPTEADIKIAYAALTSLTGVKEERKEFITKIYKYIFNEEFDWNCRTCVNNQARRFRIYLNGK